MNDQSKCWSNTRRQAQASCRSNLSPVFLWWEQDVKKRDRDHGHKQQDTSAKRRGKIWLGSLVPCNFGQPNSCGPRPTHTAPVLASPQIRRDDPQSASKPSDKHPPLDDASMDSTAPSSKSPGPLPRVPGPKLAPFTRTAFADIEFVKELGDPDVDMDSFVWKVRINGEEPYYALKMVRNSRSGGTRSLENA